MIEFYPGRFATLSAELSGSGWLAGDRLFRRRRLHLGDAEHLRRFRLVAVEVKRTLIESNAWHKTQLIKATYAVESVEGDSLTGDYGKSPMEWNLRFADYYDVLHDLEFTMIEPREELLFSARSHVWGLHLIHYQEPASLDLMAQLLARHEAWR